MQTQAQTELCSPTEVPQQKLPLKIIAYRSKQGLTNCHVGKRIRDTLAVPAKELLLFQVRDDPQNSAAYRFPLAAANITREDKEETAADWFWRLRSSSSKAAGIRGAVYTPGRTTWGAAGADERASSTTGVGRSPRHAVTRTSVHTSRLALALQRDESVYT